MANWFLALLYGKLSHLLSDFLNWILRVSSGLLWLCWSDLSGRCGLGGRRGLGGCSSWLSLLQFLRFSVDKFYSVSVDDAVTLTLNFKVVGNQVNGPTGNERVLVALRLVVEATGVSLGRVAASPFGTSL